MELFSGLYGLDIFVSRPLKTDASELYICFLNLLFEVLGTFCLL